MMMIMITTAIIRIMIIIMIIRITVATARISTMITNPQQEQEQ